jgi:hypothetical protein
MGIFWFIKITRQREMAVKNVLSWQTFTFSFTSGLLLLPVRGEKGREFREKSTSCIMQIWLERRREKALFLEQLALFHQCPCQFAREIAVKISVKKKASGRVRDR